MKTIETTVTIGEDHNLNIQLPNTIPPGDAHVVVVIEEKAHKKKDTSSMERFLSNCRNNHLNLNDQINWSRDELYR